jgi:hypothetical protein
LYKRQPSLPPINSTYFDGNVKTAEGLLAHVVSRGAEERVDLEEALDDILQRHEGKRGDRWKEDRKARG